LSSAHPHISAHRRDELRRRLEERAQVLRSELAEGMHSESLRVPADDRESGDVAASVSVASIERDADELRDVEEALERMTAGRYGLCVDCGVALPSVRLDAWPQAKRCVRCEGEHERGRTPARL
jgi:RNA polymerase-binding transcription factor DksA